MKFSKEELSILKEALNAGVARYYDQAKSLSLVGYNPVYTEERIAKARCLYKRFENHTPREKTMVK